MFGNYGSVFDVATADNSAIRDRALSVAQLEPGRATVYGAHQAGGMLMQNLAGMAGMKTARQEKAELITKIMEESQGLDPNSPNSSLILSQKFASAGFPNVAQQFAQKYRDMSVKDREQGQKDTELELKKESNEALKAYYESTVELQGQELEFKGEREVTRKEELAAALKISEAEVTRLINQGELKQIPVPGNTTGAMMWARITYDKEGLNPTITPLKYPVVTQETVADTTSATVTEPKEALLKRKAELLKEQERLKLEVAELAVSSTDDTPLPAVAAGEVPNLNTRKALADSGFMISNFGQDERTTQLIGAEDREIIASRIEADYPGDTDTIEGIKAVRKIIKDAESGGEYGVWEGSLTDSPTYSRLENSLVSREASESSAARQTRLEEGANLAALQHQQDDDYKRVIQGNDAKDLAGGYILKVGHKLGDTEADMLAGQIGADINAYDMALAGDRNIDDEGLAHGITPAQTYLGGYYQRALAFPGVYIKDIQGWGTTEYDSLKFKTVLNKAFARGTSKVFPSELENFIRAGLFIPNLTVIKGSPTNQNPNGIDGTLTLEELNKQIDRYNNKAQ